MRPSNSSELDKRPVSKLQVLCSAEVINKRRQSLEMIDHERKQFGRTGQRIVEADAGGKALALQVFQQWMVGGEPLRRAAQAFAPELVVLSEGAAVGSTLPRCGIVHDEVADVAQRVAFRVPQIGRASCRE